MAGNELLRNLQPLPPDKASALSASALAFLGDGVETLYVRARLALSHDCKSGRLHELAAQAVNAAAQAGGFERVRETLTEEELAVFRRARNAKTGSVAKNAKITDYRKATGLEAVFGYLYISGQTERLLELLDGATLSYLG